MGINRKYMFMQFFCLSESFGFRNYEFKEFQHRSISPGHMSFGMPLYTDYSSVGIGFYRFHNAILCCCCQFESGSHIFYTLMMEAVDKYFCFSKYLAQLRLFCNRDFMCSDFLRLTLPMFYAFILMLCGNVLIECSSKSNIDRLLSSTYPQHRDVAVCR